MKILVTGMSASQYSAAANTKKLMFAGVLSKVLSEAGHSVTQKEPSVTWGDEEWDKYDTILLGLSPLTSVSANHVYGGLHVMSRARSLGKLKLFVDSPEPSRILPSLRAIERRPDNLVKAFFSNRKGFAHAADPRNLRHFTDEVDALLNEQWPTTLHPSLPWHFAKAVVGQLPEMAVDSVHGVNLDSYLLDDSREYFDIDNRKKWVVDSFSPKWTKDIVKTISSPVIPMSWSRGLDDSQVSERIDTALGALIARHHSGTWWSYRLIQALNNGVPVITDWKESEYIGAAWGTLGSAVEDMSADDRLAMATEQAFNYKSYVPDKDDALNHLQQLLEGAN